LATDDIRFAQTKIPITDSVFEYKLNTPYCQAYELVFQDELYEGSWRPIYFFPEKGEINCLLYPIEEYDRNHVICGKLNKEYYDYTKKFDVTFRPRFQPLDDSLAILFDKNEYSSKEMDSLYKALQIATDDKTKAQIRKNISDLISTGNDLNPKAKAINRRRDLIFAESTKWEYDYIQKNPSLVSYYFLLKDLKSIKYNKANIEDIKSNYSTLSKAFPNHPYTMVMKDILNGIENIKIGGKFIDFSLPDLNGNIYKLSDIIKDKYAIIDLWASWCGPCILTSRTYIPVYDEFKDNGFTICGVAAEINNTDAMRERVEKEKYPWINLVELDYENHIWDKYGVSNSGGGTFLVDNKGIILSINPSADDIKKILTERMK